MVPELYSTVYTTVISLLCLGVGMRYVLSDGYELQEQKGNMLWALLIATVLTIWLGFRPISQEFGDMPGYAMEYINGEVNFLKIDWRSEWVLQWIGVGCRLLNFSVHEYFFIVEAGYIFSILWCVKRLMPLSTLTAFLFCLISFSFFTYGVNGIRNGLACHITLLAFTFLLERKLIPVTGGICLALVAFGIHRTVLLPLVAFCVGMLLERRVIIAFYIWIGAFLISLVDYQFLSNFDYLLDFDARFAHYVTIDVSDDVFNRVGYRWDFLLYGIVPIIVSLYFIIYKKITDTWYSVISIAYILANAAWLVLNQVAFSNRFAYLSWFMYPVVISYPLLNFGIWDNQDKKIGYFLIAYMLLNLGISVYMNVR